MAGDLSKLTIDPEKRVRKDVRSAGKKKWALIGIGIAAIVYFAVYRYYYYAVPVTVKPVEMRELGLPPVRLTAGGYIVADPQIAVSAKLSGRITSMKVKEGDAVKKGELLAIIEGSDLKAQYADTKLSYDASARQLSRMRSLYRQGIISRRELETAEIDESRSRAQLATAQVAYEQSEVRSPIDGTIIKLVHKEGEYLSPGLSAEGEPGTTILRIGDLTHMKVEIDINESDLSKVKMGGAVLVFPDAFPEQSYHGKVSDISPMADRQKSIVTVKVDINLPPGGHQLQPEMSARVLFLEREMTGDIERAILIPDVAIRDAEGQPHVFLFKDDRVSRQTITLGKETEGLREVTSGLKVGDPVILDSSVLVRAGRRVKVKSE